MAECWYQYMFNGVNCSSGRDATLTKKSGNTAAPTAASITNIEFWLVLSVNSPASSTNRFKWIQYNGSQVVGQTDTTGINVWNYHGYYSDNPSKKAYCYASTTNSTLKTALAGASSIAVKVAAINTGQGTSYARGFEIKVTYTPYSACGAPTSVTGARTRASVTVSWSGATSGTSNTINGYDVRWWYNDGSANGVYGTIQAVSTTATSGTYTFTGLTQGRTYQFGVRTKGTAGSSYYSTWTWSANIAIPTRPTVTAGTVITKTQMDNLKSWVGAASTTPTTVTVGNSITATIGNTYRASSATAGGSVTATWYNTD